MYEFYLIVFIVLFCILSGFLIFVSYHKHLLITLLSLEYIMLNIFLVLVLGLGNSMNETYLALVFLIYAVSEGSVGLSMLVSFVRTHGSDYFKSMNMVW